MNNEYNICYLFSNAIKLVNQCNLHLKLINDKFYLYRSEDDVKKMFDTISLDSLMIFLQGYMAHIRTQEKEIKDILE